jgi:hypoxanthine phosphoribosyltransferase
MTEPSDHRQDSGDFEILITSDELRDRIRELGEKISECFPDQECLVIPVLDGALVFAADLIREMRIPLRLAPLKASSYGNGTKTSGTVSLSGGLPEGIAGAPVLLVDDILDTGTTLRFLTHQLAEAGAASVTTCVLLRKERSGDLQADFVGFDIPDRFVVGYGLDLAGHYRNLPHIACLPEEDTHSITSR